MGTLGAQTSSDPAAAGPGGAASALPGPPLPVDAVLAALLDALDRTGRAVLAAPPGAGKTTRVPLALLARDAEAGRRGRIVVLEPRRVAARAAAARMAAQLGEPVGQRVGLTTRDERHRSRATRIEVVTEGVLLRRLQRDPSLPGVGLLMFDEFHERNLEADLALAFALETGTALGTTSSSWSPRRRWRSTVSPSSSVARRCAPPRGVGTRSWWSIGSGRPATGWPRAWSTRSSMRWRTTAVTCWCSCRGPARSAGSPGPWPPPPIRHGSRSVPSTAPCRRPTRTRRSPRPSTAPARWCCRPTSPSPA
jgi:hypothetical protein